MNYQHFLDGLQCISICALWVGFILITKKLP